LNLSLRVAIFSIRASRTMSEGRWSAFSASRRSSSFSCGLTLANTCSVLFVIVSGSNVNHWKSFYTQYGICQQLFYIVNQIICMCTKTIDLPPEINRIVAVPDTKETRLNLRMKDAFKSDLQILADYLGLTLSSYAHSLLVRSVREEKLRYPEAFASEERTLGAHIAPETNHPLPVHRNSPVAKKRTG
jgi:hypothetical protein